MTTHRIRRHIVGLVLTAATFLGAGGAAALATAPAAAADVTIAGVTSFARPYYDQCNHQVLVAPATNEELNGRFTTYFRMAVYDYGTRQWTWTGWQLETGTNFASVTARSPYQYAYMQYARYLSTGWTYGAEYQSIQFDTLDNLWCSAFGA